MKNTSAVVSLTEKQQIWLNHIAAAQAQGKSLSQYAQDNNLKLSALYNWKWVLKSEGKLGALNKKPFIKVARPINVIPTQPRFPTNVQIRFPNQTQVDIQASPDELPQLLTMVKSL